MSPTRATIVGVVTAASLALGVLGVPAAAAETPASVQYGAPAAVDPPVDDLPVDVPDLPDVPVDVPVDVPDLPEGLDPEQVAELFTLLEGLDLDQVIALLELLHEVDPEEILALLDLLQGLDPDVLGGLDLDGVTGGLPGGLL